MPAPTDRQVAPGSSIGASTLSQDVRSGTHNLGSRITIKLGSREECIGTLERLGRAIMAGRVPSSRARDVTQVVRIALEGFASSNRLHPATLRNRPSTGAREASRRVEADPIGPPDEPEPEPIVASEPTFEERVLAARKAERKAAEKAARRS